jgi:hypothetical protein
MVKVKFHEGRRLYYHQPLNYESESYLDIRIFDYTS